MLDHLVGPNTQCPALLHLPASFLLHLSSAADCTRRCGAAAACNPLCVAAVQEELSPARSAAVLQQQHLFSLYVHARAHFKDYPEDSVFQGRLIPDRAVRGRRRKLGLVY